MRGRGAAPPPAVASARLDVWLWRARVVKTRALAAALVSAGHVRRDGRKIDSRGRTVKPGDVLTIALDRTVRVLRVVDPGERRGPAREAATLYDDLGKPDATRVVLAQDRQSG